METGVLQHWHIPKTDDLVIASHLCYVAHYFCIGNECHKSLMLSYLTDIFTGEIQFQRDPDGIHYSHKTIWECVFSTLSTMEQHATSQVFSATMREPVYYKPGDVTEGRVFTEYAFDVKFQNSLPIYYFTLGKFDKLLLPLSVSMFANHNLLQVSSASVQRLAEATLHLTNAIQTQGISTLASKRVLQSIFSTCRLRV